jgi:polyhydroxybutyrate depolymerase
VRTLAVAIALAAAWSIAGAPRPAAADLAPGDHARTITFDGLERIFDIHVPPGYDGSVAVPLVLDLHGFTSNKNQQKALSGLVAVSNAEGFLLVHPQGTDNSWNAGFCCGQAVVNGVDDVGFLTQAVHSVAAEANVDPSRVYTTGLSNGGAMSQRLACEAADVFAAAAPLAFPIPFNPVTQCQPSRSIPVLTFMGLTDVLVPYNGSALFPSAQETLDHWRSVNGCGAGPLEEHVVSGNSFCDTDTSCADGVHVGLCSIEAASFGGTFFDGHILYINDDFDLAALVWDFLQQFQHPDPATPAPIPLLSPWGLVALVLAVAGAGGVAHRRRVQAVPCFPRRP